MNQTLSTSLLSNNTHKEWIKTLTMKFGMTTVTTFIVFTLAFVIAFVTYHNLHQQSRDSILSDATNQGEVVIKLSQGFVKSYSKIEAAYAKGLIPNPAIFRTHALEYADLNSLFGGGLHSEVIGFPGKSIRREPTDEKMRRQMLELQKSLTREVKSTTFMKEGQTIHRSIWAFYAIDQTCVNCHNNVQGLTGENKWKIGDLMGAQVVEKNIEKALKDKQNESLLISILVFFTVLAVSFCFIFISRQVCLTKKLADLASTDAMTGCINRREMYQRVAKFEASVSGAILMLDIDKFKKINDNYGHAAGDLVIKQFSRLIRILVNNNGWVARVGGEEFLVWLPNVTPKEALLTAENLRKQTELSSIEWTDQMIEYTVSIGLHAFTDESPKNFDDWVNASDELLFIAKKEGRNRVAY